MRGRRVSQEFIDVRRRGQNPRIRGRHSRPHSDQPSRPTSTSTSSLQNYADTDPYRRAFSGCRQGMYDGYGVRGMRSRGRGVKMVRGGRGLRRGEGSRSIENREFDEGKKDAPKSVTEEIDANEKEDQTEVAVDSKEKKDEKINVENENKKKNIKDKKEEKKDEEDDDIFDKEVIIDNNDKIEKKRRKSRNGFNKENLLNESNKSTQGMRLISLIHVALDLF